MSKRATVLLGIAIAAISVNTASAKDCKRAIVSGSAKTVVISAAVTRTPLPIAGNALQSKAELVLRDIRFDSHPGTQFNVVLERRDDPTKRARVGTLSFYMPTTKAGGKTRRTFDISDELRQIAASPADLENVDVVFEATTGRGGAHAKSTFDPQSKLTIGWLDLRVGTK